MTHLKKLMKWALGLALAFGLLASVGLALAFWHFSRDLPDHQQLTHYEPPITSRLFAADGRLIGEFARERRLFTPMDQIPALVANAFLAAEDQNFYDHPGIDYKGLVRAIAQNVANVAQNRRMVGASTITQQVAKNFLLTNEVSIERKIKEIILAFRIERAYDKDRILELYLNQIFLGSGAYGVTAAAQVYFGKSLDELTIPEAAFLAALPKAPSSYNPLRNPDRATARRNWVIGRMHEEGMISAQEASSAQAEAIRLSPLVTQPVRADWFNEEIRRELVALYGEEMVYEGGLNIQTTLNPRMQELADVALKNGLLRYDQSHGWRGALGRVEMGAGWEGRFNAARRAAPPGLLPGWRLAMVTEVASDAAKIALDETLRGRIALKDLEWARENRPRQRLGPPIKAATDVLTVGDLIIVEAKDADKPAGDYLLRQIPNVGGAIVAMDPHTGRVLAMSGGWDFRINQFNRATQALRQPGSSFKPFVYLAALDHGFTPASMILDGPGEYDQGRGMPKWRPKNYGNDFLGPTNMRRGLELSRNLMTVRVAHDIGMDKVVDYAKKFGIVDQMAPVLAMSLGAGETTLLKMTTAYGMLANGGQRIAPYFVERIQDRTGKAIQRAGSATCENCKLDWQGEETAIPVLQREETQVNDPASVFQMVSILEGVTKRGTAASLASLGRPLAGKTGTTNDSFDAWFVGFSPDLVVGVYLGFDSPRTLGPRATGGSLAVPIFKEFMVGALKDMTSRAFPVPPGVRFMQANGATEVFKEGEDFWSGKNLLEGDAPFMMEEVLPDEGSQANPPASPEANAPASNPGVNAPAPAPPANAQPLQPAQDTGLPPPFASGAVNAPVTPRPNPGGGVY